MSDGSGSGEVDTPGVDVKERNTSVPDSLAELIFEVLAVESDMRVRDSNIVAHSAAKGILAAGWRPPARVIETPEELDACDDFAVLHWLDDAGLPHVMLAVAMRRNVSMWSMTVLHEGGSADV